MKYGLSHDLGKAVSYEELKELVSDVKEAFGNLAYLIGKIEMHTFHNGIRFPPSREYHQKQINLILKTKVFPKFKKRNKHYIFSLHKD